MLEWKNSACRGGWLGGGGANSAPPPFPKPGRIQRNQRTLGDCKEPDG